VAPIATEYECITSKLSCGNMWGLLPQMGNLWQYYVLLQRNVVVAINFVAIDGNPCSEGVFMLDSGFMPLFNLGE
jgi:hypothetical protein